MSKPEFVAITYIATTPEKLWAALTQGEITRRYWHDRRIESDWQVGSPMRFYEGDSAEVTDSGDVQESDPPRRLVYSFRNGEPSQRKPETRLAFTIEPQPETGIVKLTVVHDLIKAEDIGLWREGWSPKLATLKSLLEGSPAAVALNQMSTRMVAEHRAKKSK